MLSLTRVSSETETFDDNLTGWTVTNVTSRLITVKLEFRRPLLISQADRHDLIVVSMDFRSYTDSSGQKLPNSVLKVEELSP